MKNRSKNSNFAEKPKELKVGMLSLGCPRNLVDSEAILARLNMKGYHIADNIGKADIGIVNTCAFLEDAKRESVDAILEMVDLKKEGRLKKIVVYGCLAQRYKDGLKKELPEVDAFVGNLSLNHQLARYPLTPRHYAYLKICEGCIHRCSYCAIPGIKGKFSSLKMNSILKKAGVLDQQGISELNIIGQDLSGYGRDLYGRRKLTQLLRRIIKHTKNIPWIRLLYLYPDFVIEELLDLMRDEMRICRYIDLPIQHINGRILKLMRRGSVPGSIIKLLEKIRNKVPEAALRTSLIVGFPSETDKEFQELLDFIQEFKFERLGAFMYSREEGTPAYNFPGQIPQDIKRQRFNDLMLVQQKISQELNKRFLDKTIEVLIDAQEKGSYLGRSQYDAPEVDGVVYLSSRRQLRPGELVKARVSDTLEYDLVAEA